MVRYLVEMLYKNMLPTFALFLNFYAIELQVKLKPTRLVAHIKKASVCITCIHITYLSTLYIYIPFYSLDQSQLNRWQKFSTTFN